MSMQKGTHILVKVEYTGTSITIIQDGELTYSVILTMVWTVRQRQWAFPEFGDRLDANEALDVLCSRKCINPFLDMESFDEEISDEDRKLETARAEADREPQILIGNISRIMDYYISRHTDTNFDSIVCCGLGAQVRDDAPFLQMSWDSRWTFYRSLHFALPAGGDAQGLPLRCSSFTGHFRRKPDGQGQQKEERKRDFKWCHHYLCGGNSGRVVLTAAGYANRIYQQHEQELLNQRISRETPLRDLQCLYQCKGTVWQLPEYVPVYKYPNEEGLRHLSKSWKRKCLRISQWRTSALRERRSAFHACGQISKSAAANTIMQLCTFESLSTVTTTGIDEAEDGTVS